MSVYQRIVDEVIRAGNDPGDPTAADPARIAEFLAGLQVGLVIGGMHPAEAANLFMVLENGRPLSTAAAIEGARRILAAALDQPKGAHA